jgi:dolichyl-phosphate-mannose-protein mannosyltransferase
VPIKFDRPLPVAILLGIITQALFCWRLAVPHMLVFDEVHYVPAARTLLTLAHPANAEHPLLGKELIALGVWMFGDTPVGWRAMSTLAGTATVLGCYAALWLLYRRVWTATLGAVLVLLNFTVFIQSRIAMLDGFMAAFVVLALACLLWSAKANGAEAVWARWIGGAMFLGLAVACKWAAAPYVLFAALAFLLLKRGNPHRWPGLSWWAGPIMLGVVSVATYLATFMPAFFYATEPISVSTLLPYQLAMFKLQEQVLPPHTYQSSWEGWVLMIRPIWYLYEPVDGAQRGILFVGNPVIMWGGLFGPGHGNGTCVQVPWPGFGWLLTWSGLWFLSRRASSIITTCQVSGCPSCWPEPSTIGTSGDGTWMKRCWVPPRSCSSTSTPFSRQRRWTTRAASIAGPGLRAGSNIDPRRSGSIVHSSTRH